MITFNPNPSDCNKKRPEETIRASAHFFTIPIKNPLTPLLDSGGQAFNERLKLAYRLPHCMDKSIGDHLFKR